MARLLFHVVHSTKEIEIFRTFLSSMKIEHRSNYMKKLVLTLLVFVWAPNRAAMIQSSNRLRRFLSHGPFAWSKKRDFLIYIMMICSPLLLIYFSRYFCQSRRFLPPGTFTFSTSSFHVLLETRSTVFLTKYEKKNMIRWETVHSKIGFFKQWSKIEQSSTRIEADFVMYSTSDFDFWLRWTFFKVRKLVPRSARPQSWLYPSNYELINIHTWLCANKLFWNFENLNFILFHPPQKKLQESSFNLKLCNRQLKREYCIKYLGILIDSHLNWKKTKLNS